MYLVHIQAGKEARFRCLEWGQQRSLNGRWAVIAHIQCSKRLFRLKFHCSKPCQSNPGTTGHTILT